VIIYGLVEHFGKSATVRYVGSSKNPNARFRTHLSAARSGSKLPVHQWIRSALRTGRKIDWSIIAVCRAEKQAEVEHQIILLFEADGILLTNSAFAVSTARTGDDPYELHLLLYIEQYQQFDSMKCQTEDALDELFECMALARQWSEQMMRNWAAYARLKESFMARASGREAGIRQGASLGPRLGGTT
jgi:hypothetical protein